MKVTIEDLNIAELIKHGFDDDVIANLLNPNAKPHLHIIDGNELIIASSIDKKIYLGISAARKFYLQPENPQFPLKFPTLIGEYYDIKLANWLIYQKELMGSMYHEVVSIDNFRHKELNWVNKEIEGNVKQKDGLTYNFQLPKSHLLQRNIDILKNYLAFLNRLSIKEPKKKKNGIVSSDCASSINSGFQNIFTTKEWSKYIDAFEKTEPPLLSERRFIGNRKKHIGVICAWIYELKNIGTIKQTYSRSKLAEILNAELKDFNMGSDGKTFDNTSHEYTNKFKSQLLDITK